MTRSEQRWLAHGITIGLIINFIVVNAVWLVAS